MVFIYKILNMSPSIFVILMYSSCCSYFLNTTKFIIYVRDNFIINVTFQRVKRFVEAFYILFYFEFEFCFILLACILDFRFH
jgi:hypothetical protein